MIPAYQSFCTNDYPVCIDDRLKNGCRIKKKRLIVSSAQSVTVSVKKIFGFIIAVELIFIFIVELFAIFKDAVSFLLLFQLFFLFVFLLPFFPIRIDSIIILFSWIFLIRDDIYIPV